MSQYSEFFLRASGGVVALECFELAHPDFSETYRIVLQSCTGIRVRHEDGLYYDYQYCPAATKDSGNSGDLDQKLQIGFGDLGEIIPKELDRVKAADNFVVKPTVRYRIYRSDDLDNAMVGPAILQGTNFTRDFSGSNFEAHAPYLNITRTGEFFSLTNFPGLRGFL